MHHHRDISMKKQKEEMDHEIVMTARGKRFQYNHRTQRDKFSFSPTNFETYPHNYEEEPSKQFEGSQRATEKNDYNEQVEFSNQTESSLDDHLHQLSEELELKTIGMDMAIKMVEQIQLEKKSIEKEANVVKMRLKAAEEHIRKLQKQLVNMKSMSSIKLQDTPQTYKESTTKKSITKMVVTQNSIPNEHQQTLKMISVDMFKQYADQYDEIFRNMLEWVQAQKQQQLQSNHQAKIDVHLLQSQQLTTSISGFPTKVESDGSGIYVTVQAYNQLLSSYKEYQEKMEIMLLQSINFIEMLSVNNNKSINEYDNFSAIIKQFDSFIPPQLLGIITKEINKIIDNTINTTRRQNKELRVILEELIRWVKRNLGQEKMHEFSDFNGSSLKKYTGRMERIHSNFPQDTSNSYYPNKNRRY